MCLGFIFTFEHQVPFQSYSSHFPIGNFMLHDPHLRHKTHLYMHFISYLCGQATSPTILQKYTNDSIKPAPLRHKIKEE